MFNVCDGLIGLKRSPPLPSTYPQHDQPDVFNNFLQKIIQSLRDDLDQQSLSPTSCRLSVQQIDSSFHSFHPIIEAELKATILKSKPTSCSLDPLPTSLLESHGDLLRTLTNTIDFPLLSGTFPSTFRSDVVKPLLKKASLDPNNLKKIPSISNLPFVSKIAEKIVLQKLLAYLTEHNLICPSQSAYRR